MKALLSTVALVTAACGSAVTAASPSPSNLASSSATTAIVTATPTPTAVVTRAAAASASPQPAAPTPVLMSVSGHVTSVDGHPIRGVRLRFGGFALAGGCVPACPQPPGPDVIVTSDANGAYAATVSVWTLEALANSSSSQLSVFVTPPTGMKIVAITQSTMLPIGTVAPNSPEWYFMLERQITGPIDVTLAPQ